MKSLTFQFIPSKRHIELGIPALMRSIFGSMRSASFHPPVEGHGADLISTATEMIGIISTGEMSTNIEVSAPTTTPQAGSYQLHHQTELFFRFHC